MARTVLEMITSAYRKNGIRNLTDTQKNDALADLQDMISNLSVDGLIIPYETTESFSILASGASSYTFGSGGDFDSARPTRVVRAYFRRDEGDQPVKIISKKEYDLIYSKSESSTPSRLYYDPQYPLGIVYLDCTPSQSGSLFLVSEKPITEFTALTEDFVLPEEYREMVIYNLTIRLSSDEDNALADSVFRIANDSLERIMNNHAEYRDENPSTLDSAVTYRRDNEVYGISR